MKQDHDNVLNHVSYFPGLLCKMFELTLRSLMPLGYFISFFESNVLI